MAAADDPSVYQVADAAGQVAVGAGAAAAADGAAAPEDTAAKVMETLKSVGMRALIFYFVMQFFRKPATAPEGGAPGKPVRAPASNLFTDGMGFDMYVYVSEQEEFSEFHVPESLVWKKTGVGVWQLGPGS